MGADPQHDEPLRLLGAVGISLRVPQGLDLDSVGLLDLVGCSVADEDGLASPFDNDLDVFSRVSGSSCSGGGDGRGWAGKTYVLAFGDGGEIDLDFGQG